MKRLLLALLAALLAFAAPLAQGDGPGDEIRFTLRDELLRLINRDRAQFGMKPVALDPVASALADEYCHKQIHNGTTGHFTLDGLAPYMRYSLSGGNDGVSENVAAWSANYSFGDRALYDMMRRSEQAMMAEAAPHDGHRRTILDPFATHVGIGLAWEAGEFRIAEEFIRRYVEWTRPLPRNATPADRVMLRVKPHNGYAVEAITVHHEPLPKSMSAKLANDISSYALPEKRREYLPKLHDRVERTERYRREVREEYSDGSHGDFDVADDGSVNFAVPFPDGPGVYTVVVWVHGRTHEPIAASNVSVRVAEAATAVGGTR
ncbi:MAG TPA: CAP domain-containing protein [Thermoanaerobaculia bacterium]|nr:CAP domain-containing protein [Thermoanaerobaculia bacterium]